MRGMDQDFWTRLAATRWPGLVVLAVLLVLWELSVRLGLVVSLTWPPFTEILQTWWRLIVSGELLMPLGPSLLRMFAGYAIATLVGISLGLLIGSSRLAYSLLEPLVELIRPIPSPAYIPIAILFLGIGDQMKRRARGRPGADRDGTHVGPQSSEDHAADRATQRHPVHRRGHAR
jgi:ABC-type nitrate/sulfonate/bicarbonate transport system permease component